MVLAWRETSKASNKVKSAEYATMRNTTSDTHQAGHCWWIFLHVYLVKVIVALVYSCVKYKAKINLKMQKVGDFNMLVQRRWWCASVLLVSGSRQWAVSRRWVTEYLQSLRPGKTDDVICVASRNGASISKVVQRTHLPQLRRRANAVVCTCWQEECSKCQPKAIIPKPHVLLS